MKTAKANRDEIRKNSFTVMASKEEKERIKKAAFDMGLSLSSFVRFCVIFYLEKGKE